jgi:myo-inositol 2-dehydrogenase/D-chiro-inositol 1-dehydrogenase
MSKRVRVAIIGAGRIGKSHARTLAFQTPGCELMVVADALEDAAKAAAAECRVERWTSDTDAVMADPNIDAVVIASSTSSHAPLIIQAAQAGKDVFTEKPIALDLETTDSVLDAVEQSGVRLQVGFQRRYDKGYKRAKAMIAGGELGTIEMIRDAMRDPEPAPESYIATCGGLYRDMTIHNFDNVRHLMGNEVEEVFAMATVAVDPMFAKYDDVDTSILTLRFRNGGIASIDNSRRAGFGYDCRTEIFGSKGALMVGYTRDTPLLHLTPDGVKSDHVFWFLERFGEAYVDELKDFVACILENRQPSVTGTDGRAAIALAYACEASRKENAPVKLSRFDRGAVQA